MKKEIWARVGTRIQIDETFYKEALTLAQNGDDNTLSWLIGKAVVAALKNGQYCFEGDSSQWKKL